MTAIGKSALDIFIYSSINIAVASSLFAAESFYIFDLKPNALYIGFIFCATILTYSLHRLIGLQKISLDFPDERFKSVARIRPIVVFMAISSFIGLSILTFKLDASWIIRLIPVALICFFYVLPVMHSGKRLRDLPYIKIGLIAFVWSYIAHIPCFDSSSITQQAFLLSLLFIEKLIYIFMITIPFDIRDMQLDQTQNVKTLASSFGSSRSYKLIWILALVCFCIWITVAVYLNVSMTSLIIIILSQLIGVAALYISKDKRSDLYYSGLLDGSISLRSALVILAFLI